MLRVGHEPKLTQRQVADKAGLSLNRYWLIENGHGVPSDVEKDGIAEALGVPVEEAFPERALISELAADASNSRAEERRTGERRLS